MSSNIKVDTRANVTIDGKAAVIVKPSSNTPIETKPSYPIVASPKSFQIVSKDTYVIKRNSTLEPWFESQIDNIIDGSALTDEVSDLDNRFVNFEDGVTKEIGYLKDADSALAYDLNVLKVSNDTNTAGIQNLDIVKITANEAVAISNTTIGAWQNGDGGAWFTDQVAVVSNVAYSAAKSASTLTASINSQQQQLLGIVGDIDSLEKQIDGVVETLFLENTGGNIGPNLLTSGHIDIAAEPYATWLLDGERALKTGDTYVLFETDVEGARVLLGSWRFGKGAIDEPTTDSEGYLWLLVTDDTANKALEAALNAQETADGKIVTYYQDFPPPEDVTAPLGYGDLWLDSGNGNKMWRYQGDPLAWVAVDDIRISASVDILSEAIVENNGNARAKYGVSLDVNGNVAGYLISNDNTSSNFAIVADKFTVSDGSTSSYAPFEVVGNKIKFTGSVSFAGTPGEGALQPGQAAADINGNVTTINGGKIATGSIDADRFIGDSVWVNGSLRSSDYDLNAPYTSGFLLDTRPANGNPNIYGARIEGGDIEGATITGGSVSGVVLNYRDLRFINDAGYEVNTTAVDPVYPYDSTENTKNKAVALGNNLLEFTSGTQPTPGYYPIGGAMAVGGQVSFIFGDTVQFTVTEADVLAAGINTKFTKSGFRLYTTKTTSSFFQFYTIYIESGQYISGSGNLPLRARTTGSESSAVTTFNYKIDNTLNDPNIT